MSSGGLILFHAGVIPPILRLPADLHYEILNKFNIIERLCYKWVSLYNPFDPLFRMLSTHAVGLY